MGSLEQHALLERLARFFGYRYMSPCRTAYSKKGAAKPTPLKFVRGSNGLTRLRTVAIFRTVAMVRV